MDNGRARKKNQCYPTGPASFDSDRGAGGGVKAFYKSLIFANLIHEIRRSTKILMDQWRKTKALHRCQAGASEGSRAVSSQYSRAGARLRAFDDSDTRLCHRGCSVKTEKCTHNVHRVSWGRSVTGQMRGGWAVTDLLVFISPEGLMEGGKGLLAKK